MMVNFSEEQLLQWASQYEVFSVLQSHQYPDAYGKYEQLWAIGVEAECIGNSESSLHEIDTFKANKWCFGFLSYDLKNTIFPGYFKNFRSDDLDFPLFYFFIPKFVLVQHKNLSWELLKGDNTLFDNELHSVKSTWETTPKVDFEIQSKLSAEAYCAKVLQLQEHIQRGDIYEVNFCQEFYVENTYFSAYELFKYLKQVSPKPFSSFFKYRHQYLIGASPERFLTKIGQKLFAQPIKGTAPASTDSTENAHFQKHLFQSKKERSENVMIVDLMRNDLTQIAQKKSVKVEELFGIYTFAQVNQMISTISCMLGEGVSFADILQATFPMGSMTGAPKISAMELIDRYEESQRGMYSGSVGYFSPNGDFDFNVVIRTILYDEMKPYLSFQVGSAITFLSEAQQEYEECLLKAKAINEVLYQIKNPH